MAATYWATLPTEKAPAQALRAHKGVGQPGKHPGDRQGRPGPQAHGALRAPGQGPAGQEGLVLPVVIHQLHALSQSIRTSAARSGAGTLPKQKVSCGWRPGPAGDADEELVALVLAPGRQEGDPQKDRQGPQGEEGVVEQGPGPGAGGHLPGEQGHRQGDGAGRAEQGLYQVLPVVQGRGEPAAVPVAILGEIGQPLVGAGSSAAWKSMESSLSVSIFCMV